MTRHKHILLWKNSYQIISLNDISSPSHKIAKKWIFTCVLENRKEKKSQQWVSYCLPSSGAAVFTSSLLLLPHIASTQMSNSINLFKPGGQHGCGPRRAGAAFAAPARPLSPACYCCCHFINKAITLERGGGAGAVGCTSTHMWGRYSVSLHWGGGFNPDQLSSEARELYGTSGSSLYGVNRKSSGVCPNLRLIHQSLDFQQLQQMDGETPKRWYTLQCVSGSQCSSRFFHWQDVILHQLLSVTCLCRQIWWVSDSQKYHVIEIQQDPRVICCSSLPNGPELKSTMSFVPLNWSLCSDR